MPRYLQLDGLRGLAALYVVLHHAWLTVWPLERGRAPGGDASWTWVFAFGHLAVAVFIVLSGFVLAAPAAAAGWRLRGGARGFLLRRARRILPPYYAALALSLLLVATVAGGETGTHWDISVPVDATGVAANALMAQNVVAQGQANHVFWSIAVESQIYLLFPLFVLVCARRGLGVALAAAGALSAALVALVSAVPVAGPVVLSGLTPQFLLLFALGAGAAAVVGSGAARRVPFGALAAAGGGTVAIVAAAGPETALARLVELDVVAGAATAALLVALCRAPRGALSRLLASRPLSGLGGFSYSTYLVHAPLLQVAWLAWVRPTGLAGEGAFALLVAAGVPAALVLSYGFHLVFERPFVGARRQPSRRTAGLATPAAVRRLARARAANVSQ